MYPYLATVPSDAPDGIDTEIPPPPPVDWDDNSVLVPIDEDPSKPISAGGSEYKSSPDTDIATWHDVALSIAAKMMAKVRTDIYQQLGYSTSAVCSHLGLHFFLMSCGNYRVLPGTSFCPRREYIFSCETSN